VDDADGTAEDVRGPHRARWAAAAVALGVAVLAVVPPLRAVEEQDAVVYQIDQRVEAAARGELADRVRVAVVGGSRPSGSLGHIDLVVTAEEELELGLVAEPTAAGAMAASSWRLVGTEVVVDDGTTALRPGVPTPLSIEVGHGPGAEGLPPDPLRVQVAGSLPLRSADGRSGAIEVVVVPVEVTGADLGVPGPHDIPDERLPRPAVGEAIATALADGRPVWVAGLDDGEVAVVDARSPHTPSGLVGWCAPMPGFVDSPGGSRFAPDGGYAFGPAPHGLTAYDVEVAEDHVVVTARRAPAPRPGLSGNPREIPRIRGSSWEQAYCEHDGAQVGDPARWVEDLTGAPGWAQHDLGAWPAFDDQPDGWYRAGEADVPAGVLGEHVASLRGDVLVNRVDGVTVDAAGPPGSAVHDFARPAEEPEPLAVLTAAAAGPTPECPAPSCPHGSVSLLTVVWVTADGVHEVTDPSPPAPDAVLHPTRPWPAGPTPLAAAHVVDAVVGQLVSVERDDEGAVRSVRAAPA
jgi:hypothetical protein